MKAGAARQPHHASKIRRRHTAVPDAMLQPPPPTRQSSLDFAPPVSNPFDAAALSLTMLLCGIRTLADAQIAGDATTVADASALAELRQLRRAAETACDRLCEHLNGTTNIY